MIRRRGFTLVEILIYAFLSLLILATVTALFSTGRGHYQAASTSFLIGKEAEVGLRWIRADLQGAPLTSIRLYPRTGFSTEPPGCSFVSARGEDGTLQLSDAGVPLWQRHVFYTLVREGNGNTGSLVRWEKPLAAPAPEPSATAVLPSSLGGSQRALLRGLAWPGSELEGLGRLGPGGGFALRFVRQTPDGEELVEENPADTAARAARDPSPEARRALAQWRPLLDLQITLASGNSETGATSHMQLPFRVSPRY